MFARLAIYAARCHLCLCNYVECLVVVQVNSQSCASFSLLLICCSEIVTEQIKIISCDLKLINVEQQ